MIILFSLTDLNEQIKGGLYNQSRPEYYELSDAARDLIEGLLQCDAE